MNVAQFRENIILFDYLSFTSKNDTPEDLVYLLGLDPFNHTFVNCKGLNGYSDGMRFGSISIFWGGTNNAGTVMVNMSGQGCRDFETFSSHKDWSELFAVLLSDSDNYHITRLDVAYDDHTGVIDIWMMKKEAEARNWISKFSDIHIISGCVEKDIDIQFGSQSSEVFFRCYDKAKEKHCEEGTHWIRFELQLRRDRARRFMEIYLENKEQGIGTTFFGVVNNYVRFVKPSDDSNKSRWPLAKWWLRFLENLGKISVYTKCDQEYNLDRMANYISYQAGNAIDAFIELFGTEGLKNLIDSRQSKPNPKYKDIVNKEKLRRAFEIFAQDFEEVLSVD